MSVQKQAIESMAMTQMLLGAAVADFSDDEMYVRPVPGANHAAWQIGHLVASQFQMVGFAGGKLPPLPDGFAQTFGKDTAAKDGLAAFGYGREKLLSVFNAQRDAVKAWAAAVPDADLTKEMPDPVRAYIPTVGSLLLLVSTHDAMHLGQLQVIRRKLGKKHLM